MKFSKYQLTALALMLVASTLSAHAAETAAGPVIEPAAIEALKDMGAYLRTLKVFQVEAVVTNEAVMEDGLKFQHSGVTKILARMPDKLLAEVSNDRNERLYVYNGSEFTLFAKRLNYYATIPAPARIGQLADMLEENYGFGVPLEDLFRWGSPNWSPEDITVARDIGPSVIAGTTCQQYTFRQDGIDWMIWIQKGDFPLPRKLVITTTTDEARPQHQATYSWNLAPSFNDRTFTFDPPADAGKVVLTATQPAAAGE